MNETRIQGMDIDAAPWAIREDDFPDGGTPDEQLTYLLRYAILAPSGHNSQPWLFLVRGDEIRVFSERGFTVYPLVRTTDAADALAAAAESPCHPIVADVDSGDAGGRIRQVLETHAPSLDLLINNAGNIYKKRGLDHAAPGDLELLFRVHCIGVLACTKAALPFLRKGVRPAVINVTSRWGSIGRTVSGKSGGIYSYQIAKCAQNMLTACLDQELRAEGIRVFAVHPGRLRTGVAAADADTPPRDAALKLADWIRSADRGGACGLHDLMEGGLIEW